MNIAISIDCMGGDFGPSVTVPAAVSFLKHESGAKVILVGLENLILNELKKTDALHLVQSQRLLIEPASEVVAMDDPLEVALRRKKNSSMRVAINLVKDGRAQAVVSSGNTGALMAIARYVLKTLPGIDRPAICSILPNQKNTPTYMLDLGANVDCSAHHLHQFAIMGSALVSAVEGTARPTIGLLNVGVEAIKGNEVVKKTAALLSADHEKGLLNYYGYIEGNEIFEGTTDIVVCDGFVGNITLKAVEGLGRFVKNVMNVSFRSTVLNFFGAIFARGALDSISLRMNPAGYNGASLLGLRGLVFKSHGSADAYSFECAIKRAFDAAQCDVLSRISNTMIKLIPLPEHSGEVDK